MLSGILGHVYRFFVPDAGPSTTLPVNEEKKQDEGDLVPEYDENRLARNGTYWYPARLIIKPSDDTRWRVKWWRGCIFEAGSQIQPGSVTFVEADDLVDALWGNVARRREIRLGKWSHGWNSTEEDILLNPQSIPYTEEVHQALEKSIQQLQTLMSTPENVPSDEVPAKKWLEGPGSKTFEGRGGLVPYVGNLTIIERAQIHNWFDIHVGERSRENQIKWLGKVPIAHAFTLFLASRMHHVDVRDEGAGDGDRMEEPSKHLEPLEDAWRYQLDIRSTPRKPADPDQEAVERLEEMMFEQSRAAGKAGNGQWGLDAGDHQDRWNPYEDTPPNWDHADRPDNDVELERGPNYVEIPLEESPKPSKTRPKARAVRKRRKH